MSASLKLFALAGAVAVVAAAQPAQARTHRPHASPRMATLAGSASRSLAGANVIGHAAPASSVEVSVFLKPRHPKLLARLAAVSSARPGLSARMTNFLFRPSAAERAQLSAYMRSQGFRLTGQGMLVSSFAGTAAQAQRAFGVSLARYRGADGKMFRAPTGALRLPASIAGHVLSVDGLSTQVLVHPAGLVRKHAHVQPNALTGCPGSNGVDDTSSFEPQELAAAGAYDSQTLLDTGNDGSGQSIALVEFSNYTDGRLATFQGCYGTSVPNTRVSVNGGTTHKKGGQIEVDLDQDVVVSQAPGLDHLWTYVAKPSASQAAVLDAMLHQRTARHIRIVSDSWGLCDFAEPLDRQAATDRELQLMAVAGVSFFAASGDDGASGCHQLGYNGLDADDPAGQPYATGVGGTTLRTGPFRESVWGGHGAINGAGGGGVSTVFRKPSWQKGPGVIRTDLSSKKRCGGRTVYCREVPDIAFNANPNTGYVFYQGFWNVIGGTSAAAPLMAAFTADADTFSLANGGSRMGFANPFLYHQAVADPAMFHDVTSGNNSILNPPGRYMAAPRYDMASGWGSIDVNRMAADLAAYSRGSVKVQLTKLTGNASRNPVVAHHPSKLSGKLTDTTTHHALPGRVVWFAGVSGRRQWLFAIHTGPKGGWSVTFKRKQLAKSLRWQVLYVGEQGHRPANNPVRTLRIG